MDHKWAIITKWCLSNQVDFKTPPIKSVADFLNRKLQPSIIDNYMSAIADKLGNSPINVSKDENPLLEPLPGVAPHDKGSL